MKKGLLLIVLSLLLCIMGCTSMVTVTFDSNGGTVIEPVNVKQGTCVDKPSDPIKEGYEFLGWFYNNLEWDFSTPVNYSLTLVAQYEDGTQYKVTFIDYDGEVIKIELVQKGESATAPDDPIREGYEFLGWSVEFDEVTSNLIVKAMYDDQSRYTVTFLDYNGSKLKEEKVKEGASATPPTDPVREGYIFTGWQGSYENIQSNVIVKAQYVSVDYEYQITYELNNGIWGYSSKNEYLLAFLEDFYSFINPDEDKQTFIFGNGNGQYLGTWKNYIGGYVGTENKLLCDNDLTIDDEGYFFNSAEYKEKWGDLGIWVNSFNDRFAGKGGYYYGALDFYRYVINDPEQYISVYGENFYKFPNVEASFSTYKYSKTAITLPVPVNPLFKGWYLNSNFTGEAVTEIPAESIGDIIVYACWDTATTYEVSFDTCGAGEIETITVVFNQEISLEENLEKDGYTFIGWYLNDTYIGFTLVFNYPFSITLTAKWRSNTITLEELQYDGNAVTYRGTSTAVEIPSYYIQPEEQLRATWVSSYASTFSPSPIEATMKANLTEVLDLLEEYNMNCMIFHIRTTNNAFYQTDLAPISSDYGTYESFSNWDYLEWLIDECHKRDIEFHAWLNPYRIRAYGYDATWTAEDVAKLYADYPKNPASNPDNILMTYRSDGTQGAILNPCKEEVQDYIVDVCLEVMEKYDVDAIHFDDYFYAQMSSGITVLTEPDQDDYEEYIDNNPGCGYSKTSASNKKDWRRANVTRFIVKLHVAMTEFNQKNNRGVQLGISPTGIYRNGTSNGGSNTAGQEHYASYLFCDSLSWVKSEIIDYIMPQSYWAFTHSVAGYADVMDWWNSAVEGTRVNLYSGLGLYMSVSGGNYSWGSQAYEISNQILYTTKLKNVKGVSIYSMLSLKQVNSSSSRIAYQGLMRVKNEYWVKKVSTPSTMASKYKA